MSRADTSSKEWSIGERDRMSKKRHLMNIINKGNQLPEKVCAKPRWQLDHKERQIELLAKIHVEKFDALLSIVKENKDLYEKYLQQARRIDYRFSWAMEAISEECVGYNSFYASVRTPESSDNDGGD